MNEKCHKWTKELNINTTIILYIYIILSILENSNFSRFFHEYYVGEFLIGGCIQRCWTWTTMMIICIRISPFHTGTTLLLLLYAFQVHHSINIFLNSARGMLCYVMLCYIVLFARLNIYQYTILYIHNMKPNKSNTVYMSFFIDLVVVVAVIFTCLYYLS